MNLTTNDYAAVCWTQLWQVTVLIVAVGVLVRLFCRHRPHLAYVLWMLVIVKCLTPPLWSSPTGVFSWAQWRVTVPSAADVPDPAGGLDDDVADLFLDPDGPRASTITPNETAERSWWPVPPLAMLGVLWATGFVMLAMIVLFKRIGCYRLVKGSTIEAGHSLQSLAADLCRRLGMRREPRLVVTSSDVGPAVLGVFRPSVLLPEAVLRGKDPHEIEPILAHELVHIRRGDTVFGALQVLAQLIWWFHPLVWWANRQASREVECCCDEEVVAGLGCSPAHYAHCLLDVMKRKQSLQPVPGFPGVRPVEVTSRRLEDIMSRANRFHRRMPRWCWLVLAFALLLVLPGAGITVQAFSPPNSALAVEDGRRVGAEQIGTTRNQSERVAAIEKLGGTVEFDTTRPGKPVTSVSFDLTTVTDDDLALLEGLTELRRFGCFGSPVTDAGISRLARLQKLEFLVLSRTQVTDAGLAHLKGLANLERLFLNGAPVTGEGLVHLKHLPKLMHLDLGSCPVTDATLVPLRELKSLERLDLTHVAGVNGGFLEHLKELKNLKSLVLRYSHITDEALEKVGPLPNVQGMQLDETDVSDQGLEHLIAWPNLERLGLDADQFTLVGVSHLEKMPRLRALYLFSVESVTVPLLGLLENLREVSFQRGHITDIGFDTLIRLPNLESVSFNGTLFNDADLRQLEELESLRTLKLVGDRCTDETLSHLKLFAQIDSLVLYGSNVTDKGLRHVGAMSNLASLDLRESDRIGDAALEHLKNLRNLKRLNLGDGTRVTESGVASLQKALPELEINYQPGRGDR